MGLMLATMAFLNTGFASVGGWLCDRAGIKPVGVAGLVVMAGGLGYTGLLDNSSGVVQVCLRISVVGAGLGLFQAAAYSLMLSSVSRDRLGTASAALSLAQACGTVLSVAVVGGIFAISNDHNLSQLASDGLRGLDLEAEAFIRAFRDVFWLGAIIVLAGAVVFLTGRGEGNTEPD